MSSGSDNGVDWQVVEILCERDLSDAVGSFLLDQGAPGLQTEDCGSRTKTTAHFASGRPAKSDIDALFNHLIECFPGSARPSISFSSIAETEWAENWKAHFPTLPIGERIFVHPPWIRDIPEGRIGILLDPGMAFGTGQHGSTHGCLLALEDLVEPGSHILDLGTGSGVLSIAAVLLGANSALAIDIDREACVIAEKNTHINGVAEHIEVGDNLTDDRLDFDLVVANIFSGLLIGLTDEIERRLLPGGFAVASGFEMGEEVELTKAWERAGLSRQDQYDVDGWCTLVFRKRESK